MVKQAERPAEIATSIRLPALSPAAAAFVRHHPTQARLVIAAALEGAASLRDEPEVPAPLQPFLVEAATASTPTGIIGPDEAAKRLGVSRATIYNWTEAGRLISWRLTRQGTCIPAEQIVGEGELVPGIEELLQIIPESRAAWRFLDEESPHFDIPQRPIDALKAGKLNEVIAAARAWGESFA